MTKRKHNGVHSWITAKLGAILGAVVLALALGGWQAANFVHTALASKDEIIVVQAQATTALDNQMEDLISKIARLEAKQRKTADDRDQIKYLRDQLERIRRIRAIK